MILLLVRGGLVARALGCSWGRGRGRGREGWIRSDSGADLREVDRISCEFGRA